MGNSWSQEFRWSHPKRIHRMRPKGGSFLGINPVCISHCAILKLLGAGTWGSWEGVAWKGGGKPGESVTKTGPLGWAQ